MTDRELLELAAKAAGYIITYGSYGYREFLCRGGVEWNPLTNDGDALRLLNRLGIQLRYMQLDPIDVGAGRTVIELQWAPGGIKNRMEKVVEAGENPDKLVRLAITRAAAEIGRAMQ